MYREWEPKIFADRGEAGRQLAEVLRSRVGPDVIVLGLSRGGVPVAFEVARALRAPLDLIVVARLGIPSQPETALGALAEGGIRVIDHHIVELAMVSPHEMDVVERYERIRLKERVERLRGDRPAPSLGGRTVVIVDDGLATGSSARAACQAARRRGAGHLIVAVPIASEEGLAALTADADEVVALRTPRDFISVGHVYLDFGQTDDDDVVRLLAEAKGFPASESLPAPLPADRPAVQVPVRELVLPAGVPVVGRLAVPVGARELVIVAHASSRERDSARSRYLSCKLTDAGFATLLVDLLTRDEESHGNRCFAVPLLARRLQAVTRTVAGDFDRVDYLGSDVAAAVVLEAAAAPEADVQAVVSLGGRPDLVARLGALRARTLLIVGEQDSAGLRLNLQAAERMSCPYQLVTIPGAGHRFREPGTLRVAAAQLSAWFQAPGARSDCPPSAGAATAP
ncbi:MAG TPA: phosphoribosyltransferase family protein [Kineosporiaceae bacterium]|nr:phosphoribosyltransferase family protein [Kineosporiaceae bacterium]